MYKRGRKYSATYSLDGLPVKISVRPGYDYPKSTSVLAYIYIPGVSNTGYFTHSCDLNIIYADTPGSITAEFINEPTPRCKLKITYKYKINDNVGTNSIILDSGWNI